MAILIHPDNRSDFIIDSMEYQLLLSKYQRLLDKLIALGADANGNFHQPFMEGINATSQVQEQSSRLTEHQARGEGRQTAEAGSSNSAVGGVSQSEAQAGTSQITYPQSLSDYADFAFPAVPPPAPKGMVVDQLRLAYARFGGY